MEFLVDGAEDGAGHLHKLPGEEEWEDLDGETKKNAKSGGFARFVNRGGNNCPSGEVGGAEEKPEGWLENKHTQESVIPLLEQFFCIRKEEADKSEWSNHNR